MAYNDGGTSCTGSFPGGAKCETCMPCERANTFLNPQGPFAWSCGLGGTVTESGCVAAAQLAAAEFSGITVTSTAVQDARAPLGCSVKTHGGTQVTASALSATDRTVSASAIRTGAHAKPPANVASWTVIYNSWSGSIGQPSGEYTLLCTLDPNAAPPTTATTPSPSSTFLAALSGGGPSGAIAVAAPATCVSDPRSSSQRTCLTFKGV